MVATTLRSLIVASCLLLTAAACKKAPKDPQAAKLGSILSKRISSVTAYDVCWVTTGTTFQVDTQSTTPLSPTLEHAAFKSGRYLWARGWVTDTQTFRKMSGAAETGWVGGGFFKRQWSLIASKIKRGMPPIPDWRESSAMRYWAMFLSLPKAFPAHPIWRLEYDLSERLASGYGKVLNDYEVIDGRKCLRIDCRQEMVWLDSDTYEVRRTSRMVGGQAIGNTVCLSDYRPLQGTLTSIPWRIEMRVYDFGTTRPWSLSSRRVTSVEYIKVTSAFANDDVLDSIFSKSSSPGR